MGVPSPAGPLGVFTVTSPNTVFNDGDSGLGSLRQTIEEANLNPAADTITFDPTFFNTPRIITLQTVLPQFTAAGGALTITGPGAALVTVQRDSGAATNFRIFDSLIATTLTMSGMTVSGGNLAGDGAGLQAGGTISLNGMVFSGNQATGSNDGGAIRVNSGGFLALRNSTLSGNTAGKNGGGVYFFLGGSLVVENSTISGNAGNGTALGGGGIYFVGTAPAPPADSPRPWSTATALQRQHLRHAGAGILPQLTGTLLQNSTLTATSRRRRGGIAQDTGSGSIRPRIAPSPATPPTGQWPVRRRRRGPVSTGGTLTVARTPLCRRTSTCLPRISDRGPA